MSIDLIAALPVHAALLSGMHRICFAEPWSESAMAEIMAMPGTRGLIAVDGASLTPAVQPPGPAGFVLWRIAGDEAEILSVAVLPPWRGTGLGRAMMSAALEAAGQAGADSMFLEVAADNQPARSLYAVLGFQQVGLRKKYYAGQDAIVMKLVLRDQDQI